MKPAEIRKLSVDEIEAKLADSREELMKLRFQQVTGQLTDTSRLRLVRRDIARLQTIWQEMLTSGATPKAEAEQPKGRAKKAKAEAEAETKADQEAKPKTARVRKPKAAAAEEGEA
jgi:large subunit ribosomal protein L29